MDRQHQSVDGEKRKYQDLNRMVQYRYDIYEYFKIQFIVLNIIIDVLKKQC